MPTRLSICIPTYNRATLLSLLLNSIEREASPDQVEIAISDNSSTDDTESVVRAFASRWPSLVYHREAVNLGPDRNYLKCVAISTSPYCWLMGSDDCIAPGAASRILELLSDHPHDVYLGTRINCTFDMQPQGIETWLSSQNERFFNFSSESDFLEYHQRTLTLGALFSYLSSIVVRRASWDKYPMREHYIGSAYSHAWLLLQVARESGIYYTPEPFVLNRGGNDHFAQDGAARRLLLDLDGYLMLANDLYQAAGVHRDAFLGALRRAHPALRTVMALRSRIDDSHWSDVTRTLLSCGYPSSLINLVGPLHSLLAAALSIKHALQRIRG